MFFLKHRFLGLFFNFLCLFPLDKFKVCFVVDKDNSFDLSYKYIMDEFEVYGSGFRACFFVKDSFSLRGLFDLATSGYVFLDDNFFPLAFMNFRSEVKLVQLWHAPGVFKRFGYSVLDDEGSKGLLRVIGSKISLLTVTSENLSGFYSEAFQVPMERVKAFGFPRLDYYGLEGVSVDSVRESFVVKYPQVAGKKIVLYAPTFRENSSLNNVFDFFDVERFNRELGDEYVLLVRLHPKISRFVEDDSVFGDVLSSDGVIDVSGYSSEQDLLLLCDVLVTDYSSVMVEGVFIDKPVVFFAYDLDEYVESERGFYFDYMSMVPGPVVRDMDGLISVLGDFCLDFGRFEDFVDFEFDVIDSCSSKRIVDFLLE